MTASIIRNPSTFRRNKWLGLSSREDGLIGYPNNISGFGQIRE